MGDLLIRENISGRVRNDQLGVEISLIAWGSAKMMIF